ncbi:Terpene cyclase [Mycena sanguinolenta]|uniref:Terpene cyclase n=1 Tax=Mycena sanguinolenta TaxID=230812 RepID=A0A8H6X4P6_9AGAR|nr:Terpene cyclase [Mycena sanguinolenta]
MTALVLRLPDIHKRWPFPIVYSRWEDTVSPETLAWLESLSILSAAHLRKYHEPVNFCHLTSMAYAHFADREQFRVACDMLNILFVVDDITDNMSAAEVRQMSVISLEGLRDWETPRPSMEHPVGELHRSFSERFRGVASSYLVDRFITNYELHLKAVVDEADERDRNVAQYQCASTYFLYRTKSRRVFLNDARVVRVERLGNDLLQSAITNVDSQDIVSFNVEQARNAPHNAVIVVMHEWGLSAQDALDFVGRWYCEAAEEFLEAMQDLPPCSVTIRTRVKAYFHAIGTWVTSNYEWGLRTRRYFPADHKPLENGWVVPLLEVDGETQT